MSLGRSWAVWAGGVALFSLGGCVGAARHEAALAAGVVLEQQLEGLQGELRRVHADLVVRSGELDLERGRTVELRALLTVLQHHHGRMEADLVDVGVHLGAAPRRGAAAPAERAEMVRLLADLRAQLAASVAAVDAAVARPAAAD